MVGCSEFTRRNYLKSCAEAGMVSSPALSTYQPSSRFSSVSLGTPVGITNRAYKTAGSLPKSFSRIGSRVSGSSHLSPGRQSESEKISQDSVAPRSAEEIIRTISLSPRPSPSRFSRDRNIVVTNPFKLETDSVESYIRSRKPVTEITTEKTDSASSAHTSGLGENILQETRPTYSIRNMPLRNLDELRETIAIRRNYSKERHSGYNPYLEPETNSSVLGVPSLYAARKSEERGRISLSPSPSPSRNEIEPKNGILTALLTSTSEDNSQNLNAIVAKSQEPLTSLCD